MEHLTHGLLAGHRVSEAWNPAAVVLGRLPQPAGTLSATVEPHGLSEVLLQPPAGFVPKGHRSFECSLWFSESCCVALVSRRNGKCLIGF
jgi:hypothetical protein